MPREDGELINKILQKDAGAFDQLFYRYKDPVYRFATYLTRDRNEAEDLFQDTWLRAVKYLPPGAGVKDFRAWIFTIAVNIHRDQLRKKRIRRLFTSRRPLTDECYGGDEDHTAVGSDSWQDRAVEVDMRAAMSRALDALPVKQRHVFILKEVEGFKHAEISEMLDLPLGTVKSLLHRAIKSLQRELREYRPN